MLVNINCYLSSQAHSKLLYGWTILGCDNPEDTVITLFTTHVLPSVQSEHTGVDYTIDGFVGKTKDSLDKVQLYFYKLLNSLGL